MYLTRTGCTLNEGNIMLHLKKTGLVLGLIAILSPSFADELAPVIVTATRSAQSLVTTPSSMTIITNEDIEKSGASHLSQILSSYASIQLNDLFGNGSRSTISMRGFADNAKSNVLILVDGRRLNNPDLAAADLSGISLKDVKQIEIIQGSAGTLFGDQAVGGIINIITKASENSSSYAELEIGSYNKRNIRASLSNKIDNVSFKFNIDDLYTENYRFHNKQVYQNILGRIDYKLASSSFFIDFQNIYENLEMPASLTKTQYLTNRQQVGSYSSSDVNDSISKIVRLGAIAKLNSVWNFENELTKRESDITGKSFGSNFTQKRNHNAVTPRFIGAISGNHGDSLITIGVDYNEYDYDYKLPAYSYDTVASEQTSALYAQIVLPISENITTTFGSRTAQVKYDIKDATAFPTGKKLNGDVTVFEAGLSYKLSDKSRIFTRIDENFRFAKIDENTYTSPGVVGLKTQKGSSIEFGGDWKNSTSAINVTTYLLKLDNEIDYDIGATKPVGGCCNGANINLDPTTRSGLILDLKHKFNKKLSINTQYNYINGIFEGGSFNGKSIPFVAENNITLNANYLINSSFSTYIEAHYIGERFQAADYANTKDKIPEVTTFNLHVQYKINDWVSSIRINNLSNEKYASYVTSDGYYSAPERNISAKVRYNF